MKKIIHFFFLVFGLAAFTTAVEAQNATITLQANTPGVAISSNLFGIFFEEINSAGDGGIYAELIRNRSFEDSTNGLPFWSFVSDGTAIGQMALDDSLPLSPANPHSLKLAFGVGNGRVGAANSGYWGIPLTAGATYKLSFYARSANGFSGTVTAALESTNGAVYAQSTISGLSAEWQQFSMPLIPNTTDSAARIALRISQPGVVYLDFVSLFPEQTFHNRTNGLRPDLMNLLTELAPSFMRFPGGSWVDGMDLSNAYHWKPTVGDPANRTARTNLWGYMVSNGLGYHEYLQMCEDLGAEPLFNVNAGMDVRQNAVPTADLGPWVQEALDAIEYANGDTNTTWGAARAANGHPAPFNLRYVEIGNENGGSAYNANYAVFHDAIKSKYPNIRIIANSWGGVPNNRPLDLIDEHYYRSASWFVQNAHHYDNYSRSGPKVFVGEYAVAYSIPPATFPANLQNAIGEAAWMTGLERNSDIVELACYAPLFCNVNNPNWYPNLIYFDGTQAYGTPSYYVQQMFSRNRGDVVIPTIVTSTNAETGSAFHGAIGLGSWNTSVQYTNITVTSNGVTLYQSDFANQGDAGWNVFKGIWNVSNGRYRQTAIATDCRSTRGDTNWANYTLTLRARKISGDEGFLILFNWLDDDNWTWWNIGGWQNTQSGLEQRTGGSQSIISSQVSQTINNNQWYDIRIVLNGSRIRCYLDDKLIHDLTYPGGIIASASYIHSSAELIVKAVNPDNYARATTFNLNGVNSVSPSATLIQLTSGNVADENSLAEPMKIFPTTSVISNAGMNFNLTLPANSVSALRLQTGGLNTFTNVQLEIPSPIQSGKTVPAKLWARDASDSDPVNLATNSNRAITWTSANPAVAAVDSQGRVTGVSSGTTRIIATYSGLGLSATQSVRVVSVPVSLKHRYSFNESGGVTVADSIGGAIWNGTLPNGGAFANGTLNLNSSAEQFVQLPSGILSNSTAVTLETWVTFPNQLPVNCFFFGFGKASGNAGANYLFCAPRAGRIAITDTDPGWTGEQNADSRSDFSFQTNFHLTAVFNPPVGTVALYTNGVLAAINSSVTASLGSVDDVLNYIGKSLYVGDPYPDLILDEFRIYDGALRPDEILATSVLGANQVLSIERPALSIFRVDGNLILSWPLAAAGWPLQSNFNLNPDGWTAAVLKPEIVGDEWRTVVPITGETQFFRLAR
ncbi:MAG TPA: alpha-L-arabinofuranosidase C-terminal domain-containing protein [Verrucomicrobiae bacterium]